MMERWLGRVALVTGASSGIGAAIATVLVKNNMKVIGCGRNIERIQELSAKLAAEDCAGTLEAVECDVRREADIDTMFQVINEKYEGLDVCVNNAGLIQNAPLLSGQTEQWREMLEVNVLAVSVITREAVRSMNLKRTTDGQLINICSMSGHRTVRSADTAFYGATKSMVRALTEGVRCELRQAKSNIRIAEVSPGMVETELFSRAGGQQHSDKLFKNVKCPLQGGDIADTVLYILSAPPHVQIHDVLMRPTTQVS